ncbi:MAG: phosphohistidine phosphatase SixA [Candidatus Methylomirabilis sp.]
MDLYLMRHGIAVPREQHSTLADAERPLTEEGIRKTREVARGLTQLGVACERIFSSPLVRARQTAEITARVLGIDDRVEEWPELGAGGSNDTLLDRLRSVARSKGLEAALLVGHEPQLSELTSLLLSGTQNLSVDFKKAAVCCLQVAAALKRGEALLRWFLTPKQLRLLGKG